MYAEWRREFHEQVCRMAEGVSWTGETYGIGSSMNKCTSAEAYYCRWETMKDVWLKTTEDVYMRFDKSGTEARREMLV